MAVLRDCFVVLALLSVASAAKSKGKHHDDEVRVVRSNSTLDDYVKKDKAPERVANWAAVTSINECRFLCSVQKFPGHREYGTNAVFVAASWVYTSDYVVMEATDDGDRLKNIVVVGNSLTPAIDGQIFRIKKAVFSGTDRCYLKVSGEVHGFAPPVPSNYGYSTTEFYTLYYFNSYLDGVSKLTSVFLTDISACNAYRSEMCVDDLSLGGCDGPAMYGALINFDGQLVGVLRDFATATDPYDWFERMSYYSDDIAYEILHN